MVTPWKTIRDENNLDMGGHCPTSAVHAAAPVHTRITFERWLGLALWVGLVGVLFWNGAA